MTQATQNKTFGPRQAGFEKEDSSTWSKGFVNAFLDAWFNRNPEFFDKVYDRHDGAAVAMIVHVYRYGKGKLAQNSYRAALSTFPRRQTKEEKSDKKVAKKAAKVTGKADQKPAKS